MDLKQMDLNLLVALEALLRERSVTRAGQSCGISQSAMSHALARLRRHLTDELLVRESRGHYRLTSLAAELETPVQDILVLVQHTLDRHFAFDPSKDERVFKVAATEFACVVVLQPLLERIFHQAPNISIHIRPPTGHPTVAQLESDELDLAIWNESFARAPSLLRQTLYRAPWVCAVWKGSSSVGDVLTREQSSALPHLGYDWSAHDWRGLEVEKEKKPGGTGSFRFALSSLMQGLFLLKGTDLVVFAPALFAERLAEAAEIRLVRPTFETPEWAEAMFWHPRRTNDPAHSWLRRELLAVSSALLE